MATKKKEEELAAPEAQSGYDTSGLENRQQVEEAMAGAGYRPGQSVTNAANALKEWQDKRRSFDLPFVPRRHGTLRLRLKGRGQITLRSIAKTMAAAKGGIAGGEV